MQSKITIKLQLNEDIRRVPATTQLTFSELRSLTQSLFHFEKTKEFSLKFTDDENDLCTVSSDEELNEAFKFASNNILRLQVTVQAPKPVEPKPEKPEKPEAPTRTCKTWPSKGQKIRDSHALHSKAIALMATDPAAAQAIFREQFQICPSWQKSTCLYNLACCDSLLGNTDSALAFLSRAIEAGFTNVAHMQSDKDLDNIRHTSGYKLLISGILEKEPIGHPQKLYNLATYHSLMGNVDLAIASLEKAVQAGFTRILQMLDNPDLKSLQEHPKWAGIVDGVLQNKARNQAVRVQRAGGAVPKPRGAARKNQTRPVKSIPKEEEPVVAEEPKVEIPEPVVEVKQPEPVVPVVEAPKPVVVEEKQPEPVAAVAEPVVNSEEPGFRTSLEVLAEMGFVDRPRNIIALMVSGGDVQKAIMRLLS